MASTLLDVGEMKENFFADTSMIGIATSLPGYRFCWTLNKYFDTAFANLPENTICMGEGKGGKEVVNYIGAQAQSQMFAEVKTEKKDQKELYFFPTYSHIVPHSSYFYMLYHLKCGKKTLLPEVKHLDFLWLIQTAEPEHDAHSILKELRSMREVQLAQELTTDQLKKSLGNLLV
jgi:hypothetical protein